MQDNKIRLSPDVLEKAERIAAEWGLKNARAAVEAVFRKYCDDYLHGCPNSQSRHILQAASSPYGHCYRPTVPTYPAQPKPLDTVPPCDATDALDQLLAL